MTLLVMAEPLAVSAVAAAKVRTIKLPAYTKTFRIIVGVATGVHDLRYTPGAVRAVTEHHLCTVNPPGGSTAQCTDAYKLNGGTITRITPSTSIRTATTVSARAPPGGVGMPTRTEPSGPTT